MADGRAHHATHDLEVVAAWATGEATGTDLERAERQLDACELCVGVARDLRAITLALQELPSVEAMRALPAAPRDFRLTDEQAARLRPSAPLARWTDRFAAAAATFGRPVGASLAALGFVGLLVGATSLGLLGGRTASATSAPMAAAANPTGAPAPGDESGAAGIVPAATAVSDDTQPGQKSTDDGRRVFAGGVAVSAAPSMAAAEAPGVSRSAASAVTGPEAWLVLVSVAALVGGIGLIVIATRRG